MADEDTAATAAETPLRIVRNLGFFGYFLHVHWGGRNGKQHVLTELLAHGSQMTQRALQEASCITSASLSEVISKLEREGLVARERSERDGRQLTVTLTEAGGERAAEVLRTRDEFNARAFSCLTDAETEELAGLLDRLAEHWKKIEEEKRGEAACSKS